MLLLGDLTSGVSAISRTVGRFVLANSPFFGCAVYGLANSTVEQRFIKISCSGAHRERKTADVVLIQNI